MGGFFHGTLAELSPGDVIAPGQSRVHLSSDSRYAYAATSEADAWHYAELAWHASSSGAPRVYRVAPLGRHSHDPRFDRRGASRGNLPGDRRSLSGWVVLHEVPMPEHMGTPEDWR